MNTTRYKVLAYAASAVPIGVAGVVYAYFLTFLNPIGAFSLLTSVTIVLSALLGGRGTLWGPVLGALRRHDRHRGRQRLRRRHRQPAARPRPRAGPRRAVPAARRAAGGRGAAGPPAGGQAEGRVHQPGRRRRRRGRRSSSRRGRRPPPSAEPAAPLLEIRGAPKSFGGLRAVDGVDLTVEAGLDHRADRAQRLGQDDAVQPGHRRDAGWRAARSGSTARGSTSCRRGSGRTSAWAAPSRSPGCSRA